MLVGEVVALTAANLGRDDLADEANTLVGEPLGDLASLVRCFNLVENEIALDYLPLVREETLAPVAGRIYFTRFSRAPVHIRRVTDGEGNALSFALTPDYLFLPADCGRVAVTYAYAPAEKGWREESELTGRVSARLVSFGTACEFCLSKGQFGEAAIWEKRYRDALRSACSFRGKRMRMRPRRWQ